MSGWFRAGRRSHLVDEGRSLCGAHAVAGSVTPEPATRPCSPCSRISVQLAEDAAEREWRASMPAPSPVVINLTPEQQRDAAQMGAIARATAEARRVANRWA